MEYKYKCHNCNHKFKSEYMWTEKIVFCKRCGSFLVKPNHNNIYEAILEYREENKDRKDEW